LRQKITSVSLFLLFWDVKRTYLFCKSREISDRSLDPDETNPTCYLGRWHGLKGWGSQMFIPQHMALSENKAKPTILNITN
jgi:hypothetical protein